MDLKLSPKGQNLLSKVAMPTLLRQSFGAKPLPLWFFISWDPVLILIDDPFLTFNGHGKLLNNPHEKYIVCTKGPKRHGGVDLPARQNS